MVGKLASEQTHCLDLQFSCEAAHALILFNLEILSRLQCINDHCNALIQITIHLNQCFDLVAYLAFHSCANEIVFVGEMNENVPSSHSEQRQL